jgi:hypothetical protein
MPLRVAVVACVRTDVFERTRLFDARRIVDNFRTPSPIFAIFFSFGFADASRAVLSASFARPCPAGEAFDDGPRRLAFLSPRPTGGPALTSVASEPLFRSGRNFPAWWPTRRRVRPPSFVALRRRRPVRRRFRMLPPNRPVFDFFPPFFEPRLFARRAPDRRRSRRRVGRLRPRPSDVVSTGVAAGFFEPSSKNRRFYPFFPRFSDFLSPADRPLRVGDESRLAPRRAPTPGVRRREPCALLGWEFFRGAKNRFSPTLGAPPESPFPRTLSRCRFSSLPPSAESDGEDRVRIGPRLAILPLGGRRVPDTVLLEEFRLLSRWRTVNSVGGLPAAARLRPRLTRAHVEQVRMSLHF